MPKRHHQHSRGAALIVALFALLLITIVVLAFFGQANLNRKISFSSASQARANILTLTALNCIESDLISEIQAGSNATTVDISGTIVTSYTNSTSGSSPVYTPTNNANMLPYRMTGTTITFDTSIPFNLIKWSSSGTALWSGTTFGGSIGPKRAIAVSTTIPSQNGRSIDPSRWSKPAFSDTTNNISITPEWVLITRQGPLQDPSNNAQSLLDSGSLTNTSPNNPNYVIGRYAYMIYDEGGLLDINAAGYPSSVSGTALGYKGNQGYADLTQLGLSQAQVDQLIKWRNTTTANNSSSYISYLSGTAELYGFLKAANGDNGFVSRQDFLQFLTNNLGISSTFAQYFTTFSREINTPSWGPDYNANGINTTNSGSSPYWTGSNIVSPNPSNYAGGATMSGSSSYAYFDNRDKTASYNRYLPNVRVTTPFTRLTGEAAIVGEPLIKYRFDLRKLAWITYNCIPPSGVQLSDIYNYFGLTPDTSNFYGRNWIYNHGGPAGQIMTLAQVAAVGREPDFFEILQAVILQGSLGLSNGNPIGNLSTNSTKTSGSSAGEFYRLCTTGSSYANPETAPMVRSDANLKLVHAQEKYQIIQIGANIISQYTADNFPTPITLNGEFFYGAKNLPYINAIGDAALRPAPPDGTGTGGSISSSNAGNFPYTYQAYVHRWLTFSLWNPNQNAAASMSYGSNGPLHIRVILVGGLFSPRVTNIGTFPSATQPSFSVYQFSTSAPTSPGNTTITSNNNSTYLATKRQGVSWLATTLTGTNYFSEPSNISNANAYTSDANNSSSQNLNDGYGIVTTNSWQRAGIYIGWSISPDATVPLCAAAASGTHNPSWIMATGTTLPTGGQAIADTQSAATVFLQYEDPSQPGTWHTYQELRGLVPYSNGKNSPFLDTTAGMTGDAWVSNLIDPRSTRLNFSAMRSGATDNQFTAANYGAGTTYRALTGIPSSPHAIYNGVGGYAWCGNFVNNISGTTSYYSDRDFVVRPGDTGGWSGSGSSPMLAAVSGTTNPLRPIQLNRPFGNVAEIGYAFRDDPWKTLNFVSANSADAGLLDVFYISPDPQYLTSGTQAPPEIVAGKININSLRQSGTKMLPVLNSLISQAMRYNTISGTSVIPSTPVQISGTEFSSVLTISSSTPLLSSIGGLTQLSPQNFTISGVNSAFPSIKAQRETLIRALVNNGQTRTWNLLIDVIAQTGRYPQNSTSLNNFIVEGEKHYWLHIAIDRITGAVIDQQLEPVIE